jgi:hypothetical protein
MLDLYRTRYEHLLPFAPERWLEAQQIGLGVTLLAQHERPPTGLEQEIALEGIWGRSFELPGNPDEWAAYLTRLEALPASVLEGLASL